MKSNDYGKIYFIKQQSYKEKSFSPLQEINSNFDLLKSIELGTGKAIGITSNDELLEWKYEKKGSSLKKQEFPFLLCKPVYHFHKIKFGKVLMNKTMCLGVDVYGNVLVWGEHKDGLLGLGYTITLIENPTKVECLKNISEIALSENHAVVINSQGDAFSWGTGKYGELGLEKSIYTPTPQRVNGTRSYAKVVVGNLITCFLDSDGRFSYFGVIIKILKGTFSTITVKSLLKDQDNSDPNTLFQEKIIDELENEPFVTLSIGNGFIALLSKKGMVYTLEHSDKLTLLYSKVFVYSLTVANNLIYGLSYDRYNSGQAQTQGQALNDQTQLNQAYYLCQWVSKDSDQDVSNEIWLTMIYRITEELHLDNILFINNNNRSAILFMEKGMNLNTSVLFPNKPNDNTSHDISWDNITYNDIPIGSFGLMRKNTQNQHFLVFDSEYDDSFNMKFKRSKLHQLPKNASLYLNRTMLSEAKSLTNVLAFNKANSSAILGPLTERNNKRLFSSNSSNKKAVNHDDEIVTLKEKELQDYQKEIDSIISNLKFRQKEKTETLHQKYDKIQSADANSLFNTERKRHLTLPGSMHQKLEMNKASFEQGENRKFIYNNLDTSNPNIEGKNIMGDIEGLFNKTNNENSNNNTEIKNEGFSEAEDVNLFNKSNLLDESNQLKLSSNYVYVNPNKSNFLSPQFIKTNKMSQLYSSKEIEGKGEGVNEGRLINKAIASSISKRLYTAGIKGLGCDALLNRKPSALIKDQGKVIHFNTENNETNIEARLNTNPSRKQAQSNKADAFTYKRALSQDNDTDLRHLPYYNHQESYSPLKSLKSSQSKMGSQYKHSLTYGYKLDNFSRNRQGRQIYNIDEEDRNYYLSNDGRNKYFIMTTFDENENRPVSDRSHYVPLRRNFFDQDNSYLDANNNQLMKMNKHNAFARKMESNKMSTIVHLENSSNFAYSNDDIFEETPKFEAKNLYYMGKELRTKAPDGILKDTNAKGDGRTDTKLKIGDLVNENDEGTSQLNSNSNAVKKKKHVEIMTPSSKINQENPQVTGKDKRSAIEKEKEQNEGEMRSNTSQSNEDGEDVKEHPDKASQRPKGDKTLPQQEAVLNEQQSKELNAEYSQQQNNLLFSFDPTLAKNQSKEKEQKMKDYDDIINEVKGGESFRKAFTTSGNFDTVNGSIQTAKLQQKNDLAQSEEDLKQNRRLKQFENYSNDNTDLNNQNSGSNKPLTKQKKFIDDYKKISEDDGSYDDNNSQENIVYSKEKHLKASKQNSKREIKDSKDEKAQSNKEVYIKKYDDLTDTRGFSNKRVTSKHSSDCLYQSHSNENEDEKEEGQGKSKVSSSWKKGDQHLMSLKKSGKMTDEMIYPNADSYEEVITTNVFKYPSIVNKLNPTDLRVSNSIDNDTARLGAKEEDETEDHQSSLDKDKANQKLRAANKNYQINSRDNEEYHSIIKKKGDKFQYEDNNLNDVDSDLNEGNKTEFLQLLNQQKDYLMYQSSNNGKEQLMLQDKHSKKGVNQTGKRKPNEINTENPYDEEFNKLRSKRQTNRREHSPSENSSSEAKRQLNHLYRKNFGSKIEDNLNIRHLRVSSMPIVKGMVINPDDTFGFQDSSSDKDNKPIENNKVGGDCYSSDKKSKPNQLSIKIPNDESIIDLPKKVTPKAEQENYKSSRKNYVRSSNEKSNNSVTDQKIFTLKGYSNENDSSQQGNRSNLQNNLEKNKIASIAQFIDNKSLDIDDSGVKPGERIVQLLNKIKKDQNQIADSITHNDHSSNVNEEVCDSQSSLSNKVSTPNQNNENVYTFSGVQPLAQANKTGMQLNKLEKRSETFNNSKSEMVNQKKQSTNKPQAKETTHMGKKYLERSSDTQEDIQLSSEPNQLSKDFDTSSSRGHDKKLKCANEWHNYPKKLEDREKAQKKKHSQQGKGHSETPSTDKGEKTNLIALMSESKSFKGRDEKAVIPLYYKQQGGKVLVNKNYFNYICFLITDHMRKKVVMSCIGKIYRYQLHKEKKFACKILFRLMRKRLIFYEIKFYHRVLKIYKFLLKNKA